jgi:sterol desaturase/sphingolipid hydroxylase (fatty acid hydroxylase superfamily)
METLPQFADLEAALKADRTAPSLPGRAFVRYLFFPGLLAVSIVPWVDRHASHRLLVSTLPTSAAGSSMLFFALLLTWIFEQLYPARREWNAQPLSGGGRGMRQLGRDLIYVFGVMQLSAFGIGCVDAYLKPAVDGVRMGGIALWPASAAFGLRVALAFLAVEFFSYWIHRAAHRFKPLWQFHSTHHVVTELNALKALRTHPVDNLIFYAARTAPLMWLGAGLDEVVAALYFGGVLGVVAHANLELSDTYWGLFFNLPRAHSVHHSADLSESNSNFGCHTVLWDRVFGTFHSAPRQPLEIGVLPIGPRTLWQELLWPFYRAVQAGAEPGPGNQV